MGLRIEAGRFRDWATDCAEALATERAAIDGLNVFPVPDSDTGTNAYLTFAAAAEELGALPGDADVAEVIRAYADALLVNARGNSGIILSELVRGSLRVLADSPDPGPDHVATALEAADRSAWAAVAHPCEGTILSVSRAAAIGAREAVGRGDSARAVFEAAAEAAREAELKTPGQLEVLAQAGVVDAGGRALVVILDSLSRFLTGRMPPPMVTRVPVVQPVEPRLSSGGDLVPGGPGYEVMYLLDADDAAVQSLKRTLDDIGDSLVVVGGEGLWNIHVHVDDVGAAIEAALAVGRPHQLRVTHFAEQIQRRTQGRVVVSAAFGEGLAELTREVGAVAVPFTREAPLSQADMVRILESVEGDEIIVLPNREDHVAAFEAAADLVRPRVGRIAVIPTRVQVQALAALAVHNPSAPFDADVIAMSTAAGGVRHGAVTIATSEAITMAGPCLPGDVLGVVSGDFAIVGHVEVDVTMDVLSRLDAASAELVSLVTGAGLEPEVVHQVVDRLKTAHPHVDVAVYDGGQETYRLFVAVE